MKRLVWMMLVVLGVTLSAPAWAGHGDDCGKKSSCPMKGDRCEMKSDCGRGGKSGDCDKGHECPIQGKIMKKAKFFIENKDAIGLSEDQLKAIKSIKMDTKKAMIRGEAEMKIGMMDMEAKLGEEKLDVAGMHAMIDQATAGWGQAAKASVDSYAKLKAVLTPEQMQKAKAIWMGNKGKKEKK